MCDRDHLRRWASEALDRRTFAARVGAVSGVAALAACGPTVSNEGAASSKDGAEDMLAIEERGVSFATPDGEMDAFFAYPASGAHPGVLFWPDVAGLRESKRNMARRLAGKGYAVLVLNPYYRDVAGEQFADFASFIEADGFTKVGPWRGKHDAAAIGRDATAAVEWLDAQDAVDTARGVGVQGYCMGGPLAIWSAAGVPGRIDAAASFHGGGLVRDDLPTSPHRLLDEVDAALLIAVAQDDDAEDPEAKRTFSEAAQEADVPAKVSVYAGDHGWTVPDSPAYNAPAAEQAYVDLLRLYDDNL